jgi:hypothetical protein
MRLVSPVVAEALERRQLLSTGTFSNPAFITIRDDGDGSALPYPSTIDVSGLSGTITEMTVSLNGFGHTFPKDVDMLLVAPDGTDAVIFSDVGAGVAVSGLNITLDDAAASSLPTGSGLSSGTFKPTNGSGSDPFPPPAPAAAGNAALSSFDDVNPIGTWKLFVFDEFAENAGQITNGWSMTITTAGASGPSVPSTPSLDAASDSGLSSTDGITNDNTPTFLGTADAGSVVHLLDGSTEVGSGTANGSGIWSITTSALADGAHSIAAYATSPGGTSANSAAAGIAIDTVRPTLAVATVFEYLTSHALKFTFSENVGASLSAADLTLVNNTTSSTIATGTIDASYTNPVATFTFPGQPNHLLPDGNYTATLSGAGTADVAGNTMASDAQTTFFVLSGDANHDRTVDTLDFNALAANFGKTGQDYAHANFNYDNVVDTLDFNILAANFGRHLSESPTPALAAAPTTAATPIRAHALFGDVLVDPDDRPSVVPK